MIEDIFDVLSIKFPYNDFLILMDQRSGHKKKMEWGLNVMEMRVRFGGNKKKFGIQQSTNLALTLLNWELATLRLSTFSLEMKGPSTFLLRKFFFLNMTPSLVKRNYYINKKNVLGEEIKASGYRIRGHLFKHKLERIANKKSIGLQIEYKKGGLDGYKPKGLLQTLWESGFVDKKTCTYLH